MINKMDQKVISIYKYPLAISITLAIVLLALGATRTPFLIFVTILGAILGTFVLDAEYIINAYFIDPDSDFSKTLVGFIKHLDFNNAIKYIYYHKEESSELSLNNALFQLILAALSIFVVYATQSYFAKAFVLSIFANSIYISLEYYFKNRSDAWFWTFQLKPTKRGFLTFILGMVAALFVSLYVY